MRLPVTRSRTPSGTPAHIYSEPNHHTNKDHRHTAGMYVRVWRQAEASFRQFGGAQGRVIPVAPTASIPPRPPLHTHLKFPPLSLRLWGHEAKEQAMRGPKYSFYFSGTGGPSR